MADKADAATTQKAITQLKDIDKAISADPGSATDWEMDFMEEQMPRVEKFGENIFLSVKQCEIIERVYKEKVLGEKQDKAAKPKARYDRSAARSAE